MKIKRKYISPKIDIHRIDQEICLVMASPPTDPGGGDPWGPSAAPSSGPEYPSTIETESPFGGSSPDYENM